MGQGPEPWRNPFDPVEAEEADLWFLPAPPDDEPPGAAPWAVPRPDPAPVWRAAEAALASDLAELAFDAGRLCERLRASGPGALGRIALEEAAALSWWTGDRVTADRLALWLSYRIGAAGEGGAGLIRTAWAARRLVAPNRPAPLATALAEALGGEGRPDPRLADEAAEALRETELLSPVTRGCAAFHLWRSLAERPAHLAGLEAAVLGQRLAAGSGRALPFLPLSLTGVTALTVTGAADRRLAGWISGAHRAVLAVLMALDRLAAWQARAEAGVADLQGRTPARLIAALAAHPTLAAPQAETETGASRAAVQRNLDLLAARGLVREVTGQGRFRVWAAAL